MDVLVEHGKAHNLFPDGAPELHPDILIIKDYQGDVEEGWDWDGTTFTRPVTHDDLITYADLRSMEYPFIGDQLDDLFRAGVFSAEMSAKIQAVKDKYPKG